MPTEDSVRHPLYTVTHGKRADGVYPHFDADDKVFSSYFENEYGEGWVAWAGQDRELFVSGQDIDWEIASLGTEGWADLVLTGAERTWLRACRAAIGVRLAREARDE